MTTARVLVADDEPNLRKVLRARLERDGYSVATAVDGESALAYLADNPVDVLISDLRMPNMDGMALLENVQENFANIPVVMITAHGTVDTAVLALKMGAFDYITKPFDRDEFRAVINKAARTAALKRNDPSSMLGEFGRHEMVGLSAPMQEVYRIVDRVADTPSTVLITGESGTGKELIAKALHRGSARSNKPFISINCAAIPDTLIESELFGHEKGAFTGAVSGKPGRFELADGGTLFLDEIGEIPVSVQVKLLRALQESEFTRVGATTSTQVDVRLVAATNRDLEREIAEGTFREDLYYRLNVVRISLPALRERPNDVSLLLDYFLNRYLEKTGDVTARSFSPAAINALENYRWPGNVRELENIVERTVLFSDHEEIPVAALPTEITGYKKAVSLEQHESSATNGLKETVRDAARQLETKLIEQALAETSGNVTQAAKLLKISRKGLQTKMKELSLRDSQPPQK